MAVPKIKLVAWTAVCRQDRVCKGCTSNPISAYILLNITFFCRLCYEITGNSIMVREAAGRVLCIKVLLEKKVLLVYSSAMDKLTYYSNCI